jgi:hypothetical protein
MERSEMQADCVLEVFPLQFLQDLRCLVFLFMWCALLYNHDQGPFYRWFHAKTSLWRRRSMASEP